MSNPTNIGQKLPFRIIDFTGEDPQYPVTELLTSSPQSKGWQSERFCDWPQHLILQFFSPVRLKQLQFLSHQAKISSKIELFAALPTNKSQSLVDLEYKKLGYLALDSNEKSGFQSRELKTVYLDNVCMYLKIVLNKCYLNKFNVFNQVGIIAIGVFGDPQSGLVPTKRVETPLMSQMEQPRVIDESQFDAITLSKLKELDHAKNRAVELEDFEEAKKIKVATERLRHIGAQLKHLEESKKRAIQVEDFDSAKIINQELMRLRDTVAPATVGIKYMQEKPQIRVQFVQDEPPISDPRYSDTRGPQENGYEEEKQEAPVPKKKIRDIPPISTNSNSNANHDEQVIPAMVNKKANAFNDDEERPGKGVSSSAREDGEALSSQAQKLADPLIPILGDELTKKIFSKSWNSREEGLKLLENDLNGKPQYINKKSPGAVFVAAMGAIAYTVNDKVTSVSLNAMNVLQALLSQEPPQVTSKNELLSYIDTIINGLLDKIGDNNARVREQAENALVGMAYSPIVTCIVCVNALVKTSNTGKNKMTVSTKHIIGRLNVLSMIVRDFQIDNKDVPYQPVVAYAVEKVENSSVDIRNAATNLLIEIYTVVGDDLMGDLESVRNNQLDILLKEFDAVAVRTGGAGKRKGGIGGKGGAGGQGDSKKPIVTTNIAPQGAKKGVLKKGGAGAGAGGGNASTAPKSGENNVPGPVCEFCEKKDRTFADARKMDFHLWRECPMLLTCEGCGQIVEISQLNNHLIEECEMKRYMRKCPRCKEPVHAEDYKQHTEEMSCLQSQQPTRANRCPLCHMDIPPGDMGWKQHLLVQGCPNNERTV